ncbi:unnamed protein product [Rhizoctonia solani]|uniref:Uncharacterized protein n=1 Tax=Rhizoctonia solani TaxID=456999 RepID=A0A8H3GN34_9AGAM|nr:unnamed protein product [Rhizoctonia solani]
MIPPVSNSPAPLPWHHGGNDWTVQQPAYAPSPPPPPLQPYILAPDPGSFLAGWNAAWNAGWNARYFMMEDRRMMEFQSNVNPQADLPWLPVQSQPLPNNHWHHTNHDRPPIQSTEGLSNATALPLITEGLHHPEAQASGNQYYVSPDLSTTLTVSYHGATIDLQLNATLVFQDPPSMSGLENTGSARSNAGQTQLRAPSKSHKCETGLMVRVSVIAARFWDAINNTPIGQICDDIKTRKSIPLPEDSIRSEI